MRTFIFFLLIGLFVSGCSNKCEPVERVIIQEVKIPVKPNRPDIKCDFNGEGLEPTQKLIDCIIKQKRAIEMITSE